MNPILNKIQLYSENSAVKYPLDDQHTENIPNDILLDLSLCVPEGAGIVTCTNIVVKSTFIFVSLECPSYPIGHVMVTNPVPFRIYPLTMACPGSGWISFGPGVSRVFSIVGSTASIDRRCILTNVSPASKFKLSVNGLVYDMPPVLNIAVNTNLMSAPETRSISSTDSRCLVLRRDDTKFTDSMLKTGLVRFDPQDVPLATINGVFPDALGNMQLGIVTEDPTEKAWFVPIKRYDSEAGEYRLIGLAVFTDNMEGCADAYSTLDAKIKQSDIGYGLAYPLPLDCTFPTSPYYPCPGGY